VSGTADDENLTAIGGKLNVQLLELKVEIVSEGKAKYRRHRMTPKKRFWGESDTMARGRGGDPCCPMRNFILLFGGFFFKDDI
jgi:hypothetical protein